MMRLRDVNNLGNRDGIMQEAWWCSTPQGKPIAAVKARIDWYARTQVYGELFRHTTLR